MEFIAISALVFIFINICVGVYGFTEFITAGPLKLLTKASTIRCYVADLLHTCYACIAVIIGEAFGIISCLLLLFWIIYRLPLKAKNKSVDIPHDKTAVESVQSNGVNSRSFAREVRIAQALENYCDTNRIQLAVSTYDSAFVLPRPGEQESGFELATCYWIDRDEMTQHTSHWPTNQKLSDETEVKVIVSSKSRRHVASYQHAIQVMCCLSGILILLSLPYYVLFLTIKVAQGTIPLLEHQYNDTLNENGTSREEMRLVGMQYFAEMYNCQTFSKILQCLRQTNGSNCGHELQVDDIKIEMKHCFQTVEQWLLRRQSITAFRISLLSGMYATGLGFLIRKLVLRAVSTGTQTYPRTEWWRGAGDIGLSDVGLQCNIAREHAVPSVTHRMLIGRRRLYGGAHIGTFVLRKASYSERLFQSQEPSSLVGSFHIP
ncbi:hypothetical protein CRM22_002603 [Opisthorchis felineus]|uniref:Uncharacterized protein n=1 Tax=Opisthorchis felineus TaxID=147828 RepID=A0A4S2MBG4_OPIFE|nr:hypothetical protein CRM22_002603 [Opisthorchis felineus]